MNRARTIGKFALAIVAGTLCLFTAETPSLESGALFTQAQARIGRPLTPMSYAGVARRTTRRAVVATGVATGAAVGAAAYARPGCVQAVDPYGQLYWRC